MGCDDGCLCTSVERWGLAPCWENVSKQSHQSVKRIWSCFLPFWLPPLENSAHRLPSLPCTEVKNRCSLLRAFRLHKTEHWWSREGVINIHTSFANTACISPVRESFQLLQESLLPQTIKDSFSLQALGNETQYTVSIFYFVFCLLAYLFILVGCLFVVCFNPLQTKSRRALIYFLTLLLFYIILHPRKNFSSLWNHIFSTNRHNGCLCPHLYWPYLSLRTTVVLASRAWGTWKLPFWFTDISSSAPFIKLPFLVQSWGGTL